MKPRLSFIVPTAGVRLDGLARLFDSVDAQPERDRVEVVVVGDAFDGPLPRVRDLVWSRGPRYRYAEHAGSVRCWGHPQRTYGDRIARGEYLLHGADDNLLTEGAFGAIFRALDALTEPLPLLFQVRTWQAGKVWKEARLAHGNIDADCIVAPNDPAKLGAWGDRYEGDWDMILATCEAYGERQVWVPDLIGVARPTEAELWMRREAVAA